jgi:hypothetical protein
MTLGFIHSASNQLKSAEFVMQNIRQHYPDSSYIVLVDKGADYHPLATKYNTEILHCQKYNGYPVQPYGYQPKQVMEFLERMWIGCIRCSEDYVMMVEEDVVVLKPITIPEGTIVMGYNTIDGNDYPPEFIKMIESSCGREPNFKKYGSCGGTIFHRETFLDYFPMYMDFVDNQLSHVLKYYPTAGWIDCFMTYLFQLGGLDYTPNPRLFNIHPRQMFDLSKVPADAEIVNNFKNYYD